MSSNYLNVGDLWTHSGRYTCKPEISGDLWLVTSMNMTALWETGGFSTPVPFWYCLQAAPALRQSPSNRSIWESYSFRIKTDNSVIFYNLKDNRLYISRQSFRGLFIGLNLSNGNHLIRLERIHDNCKMSL